MRNITEQQYYNAIAIKYKKNLQIKVKDFIKLPHINQNQLFMQYQIIKRSK